MRFTISSLRVRMIMLVSITILLVLNLFFYTAAEQREQAIASGKEEALRLLRHMSYQHEYIIADTRNFLAILAQFPAVQSGQAADCSEPFAALLKQRPLYSILGLISRDGRLLCSVPSSGPVNLADRLYFKRVLETREFAIGDYQVGRVTQKPSLHFAQPVFNEQGRIQAVLFAGLDLNWLNSIPARVKLPPGTTLTVIDKKGTILSRYPDPEKWLGKSVPELHIVQAVLNRRGEGTEESAGLNGTPSVFAFRPLRMGTETENVYILLGFPKKTIYADANHLLARNLIGLGLITTLVFVLIWASGNLFFLRRVNALLNATRRLAAGDLAARTGLPHEQGEMGQLARSFDQMAASLESLRHQQDLILRSAGEGIFGLDLQGRITFINPAAAEMLGFGVGEIIHRAGHELWHCVKPEGGIVPKKECPVYLAIRDSKIYYGIDEVFWRKDGTCLPVEYVGTPIQEQGELVGAVVVFKDITERKLAEANLREARKKAERAERLASLGTMAAGIAHEINQPLNHIKIIAGERLYWHEKAGIADWNEVVADLREIIAQVDRSDEIIRRMRAFVRSETTGEPDSSSLNKVVEGALKMLKSQLEAHGIKIRTALSDNLPPVLGIHRRLEEVVINLVINAMHALDKVNKEDKEIEIITLVEKNVLLKVSDNAVGVSEEIKDKIFEPFFTTKEVGEAMGLGLSIVHSIITSFGGEIQVAANEKGGATFSLEFLIYNEHNREYMGE